MSLRFLRFLLINGYISGQWLESLRGIRIYSQCYERCSLIRLALRSESLYIHRGDSGEKWYDKIVLIESRFMSRKLYITKYDKKNATILRIYGKGGMLYNEK